MTQIINESGLHVAWILNRVKPHDLSATLIAKGTFQLRPKGTAQLADRQEPLSGNRHETDNTRRSLCASSDFVPYKPKVDLLLTGHCHAQGQKGLSRCSASFGVGEWKKSVLVFGDRVWEKSPEGNRPSPPEAFKKIALRYENSFGGPHFEENPIGTGHLPETPADSSLQVLLPNIENPNELITTIQDHPTPAGFGPLGPWTPARKNRQGIYDEVWKREHWPWLPLDFDWSYFNAAPPDQQLDTSLKGNEKLLLENMHPDISTYISRLPGLRLRWFLKEILDGVTKFREVEMKIDTLHVNMDREELTLVWRGVAPVESKTLAEIPHQYVVAERVGGIPVSPDHYAHCLEGRITPPQQESSEEHPIPDIEAEKFPRDWKDHFDSNFERALQRLQKVEEEIGDPSKAEEPDWDALLTAYDSIQEEGLPSLSELQTESNAWQKAAERKTELRTKWERERWTPESFQASAKQNQNFSRQDLSGLDLSGMDLSGINFRNAILFETKLSKTLLKNADLTRANLRKADLGEADLSGAVLESADLDEANLSRATLQKANLNGASLIHAVLRNADLSGASAERATLYQADLVAATLNGIQCPGADFSSAHLTNAQLQEADLTNASVEGAKGVGISLRKATLVKLHAGKNADFSQGDFSQVKAPFSTWEGSNLTQANFQEATLNRANFNRTTLTEANFNRSDLIRARFMYAQLERANLALVNLFRGNLEGAELKEANLKNSNLYGVELLDAKMGETSLVSTNLKATKHGG